MQINKSFQDKTKLVISLFTLLAIIIFYVFIFFYFKLISTEFIIIYLYKFNITKVTNWQIMTRTFLIS